MKHLLHKLLLLSALCLKLPAFTALAQTTPTTPQTADDYVRPYTENFQYGANLGYYGQAWNDVGLAGLLKQVGGHSLRPTLPEWFVENYGYNIREAEFNTYTNTLDMKEMTCFIEGPSNAHGDWTVYPGCTSPSRLFAHLYEPIWNANGTVNPNNYYANYVYKLLLTYGDKVRFWEVVNEPDFANGADATAWLTRAPTAAEQLNTQAPFYHYIRMLRITYEVVKKYHPEAYISMGAGYPEYVDALMRYSDNPNDGAITAQYPHTGGAYFDVLSFHVYPNYSLHYWDNSIGWFRYTRTSDYAINKVIDFKDAMTAVLDKYGYNGTLHPGKVVTLCESNVSRRTSGDRTGSDELQRNFAIKSLVLTQKNNIQQFYYFTLGEGVDAPPAGQSVSGSEEINLMGLYENLNRAVSGTTKLVEAGQAFATTSKLLYGYKYDAARTAALNLPSAINGGAFSKNGEYVYVLWAKALVDNSETATALYTFPAALGLSSVQRYEWDYSLTNAQATQLPQGVVLNGAPSFFKGVISTACTATGTLLREQWDNVNGNSVASIPLTATPTSTSSLTQFEYSGNASNYGGRLRGYLCVPQSGAYTFYISGDDDTELWLSTDDNPATKVRIATCSGWTSGVRDWYRYPTQQSAAITLTAGRRYYIEALHKQGWGNGYVSVAWRLPSGVTEGPIPSTRLSPYVAPTTPPVTPVVCSATGTLLREQWDNVNGSSVTAIPVTTAPTSSSFLTQFSATGTAFNNGARLRGYVCPPQSGAYTFYVVGDDESELWLSTDSNPATKVRIATCTVWTDNPADWFRSPTQQSAPIQLVAGTRYYIEALHKQAWGNGYVGVAWRLPSGVLEGPIAGNRLSPLVVPANRSAGGTTAVTPTTNPVVGSKATELLAYPNPFTQRTTVQFTLATAGKATLAVYDVRGQLVRTLFSGESQAGTNQSIALESQGLSAGIYVLRLVTATNVLNQKVVLSK
jgi:hypothetical protein